MPKNVRRIASQLIAAPFLLTIYLIASIIPRKKTRLIFSSWYGRKYDDSTKYLFEEAQKRAGYDPYFLVKDRYLLSATNPRILYTYSLKGMWVQLTAKFFFCTVNAFDFFAPLIGINGELVQVCHGMPIKRGFEEKFGQFSRLKNAIRRRTIDRYSYIISAHSFFNDILQKQWRVEREQIIVLPMPRCDALFDRRNRFDPDWLADDEKLVLYAPTHRNEGKSIDTILRNCQIISDFYRNINKMNPRYIPALKLHYYDQHFSEYIETMTGIRVISPEEESNRILCRTDLLISDYSGIVYDFAYLNRPIICFASDYDYYIKNSRGMYFELEQIYHHIARNHSDLYSILNSACDTEYWQLGLKVNLYPKDCTVGQFSMHSFNIIEKQIFN